MTYTVTRQIQHPDGTHIVEISEGEFDYVNPDMMVEKYKGEGVTFSDPREAVETAIQIRDLWQRDSPDTDILIGRGCTMGMTLPFDPSDVEELRKWAANEARAEEEI